MRVRETRQTRSNKRGPVIARLLVSVADLAYGRQSFARLLSRIMKPEGRLAEAPIYVTNN